MRAFLPALLLLSSLAGVPPVGTAVAGPPDSSRGYAQAPPLEDLQRRQDAWAARRRLGAWLVVGAFAASVVVVGAVRARRRRNQ
jgi:hypothetical protein